MNLIDKDALIEALGIETDCYDCEHERLKYHCDLDPVEACTKIVEAPVVTVATESAEKAIEVLKNAAWLGAVYSFEETEEAVKTAIRALQVASAQPNVQDSVKDADCISRQQAIDALNEYFARIGKLKRRGLTKGEKAISLDTVGTIKTLPSAQPELRYTKKELGIFKHGISLSLLSKRSCQHWHYDEDTATEIEFLERLYEKVEDDMRGEQDDSV